jgi:hypothetical protein
LTTGVTGTLAVANGGTNRTTMPAGYILHGDGNSVDTAIGLFWNRTNNRLGINTNTPQTPIEFSIDNQGDGFQTPILRLSNLNVNGVGSSVEWFSGFGSKPVGRFLAYASGSNGAGFKITLLDQTSATFTDRLDILNNGNTGIGSNSPSEKLHVVGNGRFTGNIAAGVTSATARLHLVAGTATASTAPLKFTSGTNLTTAEAGAMEFNGTNLFFSPSTTRHTVNHGLTGSATLNFPLTTTLLSADLTITVTGAADGDVVSLGVPNAAVNANTSYSAWVSAANTVTVRFNNYSSGTVDPASASFKVFVTK